ncbi:sigma-70 family RNA polymerase sigma factor [Amycolatopsis rhizosphaerae]|uniref:Sigma-70 family RNA polymerase sigma factor n=1 Tax=Amycolatopsis rhizosphaerae TaxID=2053003 RepID=A0A558D8W9_9PSEU|nr:sigma-70 family RNA polymerase sigma factor [Amycolatopsis rhizosphaerae]TVT57406.1 sigma-70 family RNA polymerase sigma factor [Amycolatopsis rhizosphaerae]
MAGQEFLAERFEEQRARLRAVAYRMLGSFSEADDAVQETWIKLSRADVSGVENLGAWLTTVVSRVCLDFLRSRKAKQEESLEARLPDPIVVEEGDPSHDPEHQALTTDAVGLALMIVLDTLNPAERLAFVLHDLFAVPFDTIASILDRSLAATKMMASRARRRVQSSAKPPEEDLSRQREIVSAFRAASRGGGFEALLAVLDPDVVLRADTSEGLRTLRGAADVASQAQLFGRSAPVARPVLVNGSPGFVSIVDGKLLSVLAFTVSGGRITEIHVFADPARLAALGFAA